MRIVERDIELMGWILEQKFMTREQVRRVFWKKAFKRTVEDCRRLGELEEAGFLKRSSRCLYKHVLYTVTAEGVKQLKVHGRDRGLSGLADVDHSNYRHDVVVTDLRIFFHELGYTEWLSERLLIQWPDLRRLPDGMIQHEERSFAVEYESAQKAKDRYKKMFLDYEMDPLVHKTVYVVDYPGLLPKITGLASSYTKLFFVTLQDLERQKLGVKLQGADTEISFSRLLEGKA